jgi:uncharacterized protein (TIGR03435 family)
MSHRLTERKSRGTTFLLASTAILAILAPRSHAQTMSAPAPQFDVASVKKNDACGARRGGGSPGSPGRFNQECMTVMGLVMTAYGIWVNGVTNSPTVPDITGGPDWIRSDTYDIAAKAEGNAPFPQMAGPMLRALLEDRFKLKIHRETKEVPVFFLTVAKDGPKLEPMKEGSCVPLDPNRPPAQNAAPGQPRPTYCGPRYQLKGSTMTITARGATMKQFTEALLSRIVDRPVIDKTGLAGQYDFQIEFDYTPDTGGPADAATSQSPPASDAPSVFKVLQAKLGLKLESAKGPVESLVIDRVERPASN